LEIVLAGMRGDRSVRDVCREHGIAETLYYGWRDKILEAGREALAGKEERSGERELRRKIGELERALGRKTYELEIATASRSRASGRTSSCILATWMQGVSSPVLDSGARGGADAFKATALGARAVLLGGRTSTASRSWARTACAR
jgi:transposase